MSLGGFILQVLPALAAFIVLAFALRAYRWNRQRPMRRYTTQQLFDAFRFAPQEVRDHFNARGTMSRRELHGLITATQQLMLGELERRGRR